MGGREARAAGFGALAVTLVPVGKRMVVAATEGRVVILDRAGMLMAEVALEGLAATRVPAGSRMGVVVIEDWGLITGQPCHFDVCPVFKPDNSSGHEKSLTDRNLSGFLESFGGADGTRTRDPRRDRPVF